MPEIFRCRFRCVFACVLLLALSACAQLGYYAQAMQGQMALRSSARPIDQLLADPKVADREWTDGQGKTRSSVLYWNPTSYRGGSRVMVKYVAYQYQSSLTRDEAERYLAWLNAGNVGRHYEAFK